MIFLINDFRNQSLNIVTGLSFKVHSTHGIDNGLHPNGKLMLSLPGWITIERMHYYPSSVDCTRMCSQFEAEARYEKIRALYPAAKLPVTKLDRSDRSGDATSYKDHHVCG